MCIFVAKYPLPLLPLQFYIKVPKYTAASASGLPQKGGNGEGRSSGSKAASGDIDMNASHSAGKHQAVKSLPRQRPQDAGSSDSSDDDDFLFRKAS